jgi:hypothetical protein
VLLTVNIPILWRSAKSFWAPQGSATTIQRERQWGTNLFDAEAPIAPGPESFRPVNPVAAIMFHEFLSRQADSKTTIFELVRPFGAVLSASRE